MSLYPQSEEAVQPTYATSSVTAAESPAEVGASLIALTVIDTWSVALSSSPSLAVKESTALLLLFAWLVQVMVAIAVLMFAMVPENVIELSAVPSPAAKVRPLTLASENVPLSVEVMVIESRLVSSTSAIVEPVIALATSSSVVTSAAEADHVGASLTAFTEIVNVYAEAL